MSTTTKSPLLKQHTALVKQYEQLAQELSDAKGRNDKKAALSAAAKMSGVSQKIGATQLDMRLAGEPFTPWAKPNGTRSRQLPMSQAEIEQKLAALMEVLTGEDPDSIKHSADVRISALLRAADKRGYQVADPRKR